MEPAELERVLNTIFAQLHILVSRLNAFEAILLKKNLTDRATIEIEFGRAIKRLKKEVDAMAEKARSKIITLS